MQSIIWDESIAYPEPGDGFAPDRRYPECPFDRVSSRANPVYQAVRDCLAQASLDAKRYDTAAWNPLGAWIKPGQSVFVLCNFVYQRRPRESEEDFFGKCTHASVIRAMTDYLLIAVGPKGRVRFGNAPLQGCTWDEVTHQSGARELAAFYRAAGAPVELMDLRLHVAERNAMGWVARVDARDERDAMPVDLGRHSLLAPLDADHPRYRVLDYNPDRTEACHADGRHVYILHRAILESDAIVSIPKLKTHEKVGITCALKGCVGAIAHKDCLAHHRQGDPSRHGDEYPTGLLGLMPALSRVHDRVQRTAATSAVGQAIRVAERAARKVSSRLVRGVGGAWWGNDTAWRMSLDICRIIAHANRDGAMQDRIVRPHLALIDGVVGGEGDGPLDPRAVRTGALLFADNPVESDFAAAAVMGYSPDALAIVREASRLSEYALAEQPPDSATLVLNGAPSSGRDLRRRVRHVYRPPRGWVGRLSGTGG